MDRGTNWHLPRRWELGAAVLLAFLSLVTLFSQRLHPSIGITRKPDVLAVLLTLAATLPLAAAHAHSRTVTVVTFASSLVAIGLGYPAELTSLAALLALGIAAANVDRPSAIALGTAVVAGVLADIFAASPDHSGGSLIANLAVVALVVAVGIGIQTQRRYARALEARTVELEQLRGVETREAIAQERLRIARELHDIVGHALAAITLHAQVARRRLTGGPRLLAEPLDEIVALSSDALSQTRETVGILRDDDASGGAARPPTLGDLDELIMGLRTAAARIELVRDGDEDEVPPQVQSAGYRIAQEALSNFIKHAGCATAVVTRHRESEALTVEVRDDGVRGSPPVQPGSGIRGMRERAIALGGTLHAGPLGEGGWAVKATLPISRDGT